MRWLRAIPVLLIPVIAGCEGQTAPTQKTTAPAADTTPLAGDGHGTNTAGTDAAGGGDASIIELLRKQAPQTPASRLPAGHPPIGGGGGAMPPAAEPAVSLRFAAPEEWEAQPPSNQMRRYQYQLPGGGGELIVYSFSGGGSVAANIDRWRRQFTGPDGKEVPAAEVKQERFQVGPFQTTLMEVAGQYTASMMPGMGAQDPQADYRMIAAVIETDGGPWFVKATGPSEALAAQREQIMNFILSAELAGD